MGLGIGGSAIFCRASAEQALRSLETRLMIRVVAAVNRPTFEVPGECTVRVRSHVTVSDRFS